jgi:hypothetical protein
VRLFDSVEMDFTESAKGWHYGGGRLSSRRREYARHADAAAPTSYLRRDLILRLALVGRFASTTRGECPDEPVDLAALMKPDFRNTVSTTMRADAGDPIRHHAIALDRSENRSIGDACIELLATARPRTVSLLGLMHAATRGTKVLFADR